MKNLKVRSPSDIPVLSDFFRIKRGIAIGDNRFLILSEAEIASRRLPMEVFTPIPPSLRYLPHDEVKAREDGPPDIGHRLFLPDTKLSEEAIQKQFPALAAHLGA